MALGAPQVRLAELEFERDDEHLLGVGGFGVVYRGRCWEQEVAIKVSKQTRVLEKELEAFWSEVDVMRRAISPRVVLFLGVCTESDSLITVSEYVRGKNLEDIIKELRANPKSHSMFSRLVMARDIAIGLNWLHSQSPRILHRDIKPANLMFDDRAQCVKLCDFGLSSLMEKTEGEMQDRRFRGSPLYMAPELLARQGFNEKIDHYSFALVLYELVTNGRVLFPQQFRDLTDFRMRVVREHLRPTIPNDMDPQIRDVMTRCWASNPDDRPELGEVIQILSDVIVNITVGDRQARLFWKQRKFLRETEIPWRVFRGEFLDFLVIKYGSSDSIDPSLVEDVLPNISGQELFSFTMTAFYVLLGGKLVDNAEDDNTLVRLVDYGNIITWMGGLPPDGEFFTNVAKLVFRPWFHGKLSADDAARALHARDPGTFLLRFSSVPGYFSLSVMRGGGDVEHRRVEARGSSLVEWVESKRESLGLSEALGGSPYATLSERMGGAYVTYKTAQ